MQKNHISMSIADEQLHHAVAAIQSVQTHLPGLITLTREERTSLISMGDKTVEFVNKATAYASANAGLVPGFVDMTEQQKDVDTVNKLKEVRRQLEHLSEKLDDTIMLAGSEAFSGALAIYNTVKQAAKSRVDGAKTAYDDLRVRFPGKRSNLPTAMKTATDRNRTPTVAITTSNQKQSKANSKQSALTSEQSKPTSRQSKPNRTGSGVPVRLEKAESKTAERDFRKVEPDCLEREPDFPEQNAEPHRTETTGPKGQNPARNRESRLLEIRARLFGTRRRLPGSRSRLFEPERPAPDPRRWGSRGQRIGSKPQERGSDPLAYTQKPAGLHSIIEETH